jgi:hypothetical protein
MEGSSMLQDWLPTKLSRIVAISTLPIATGGVALVHFLRPLMPSLTEVEITLWQLAVWLSLTLMCTFITLLLVCRAYHQLKTKKAPMRISSELLRKI